MTQAVPNWDECPAQAQDGDEMIEFETVRGGPLVPTQTSSGFSSYRGSPRSAFVSQLIAERHHLATQRAKRQAPVVEALRTYDAGGRIAVRRLPPGYRMTVDV
jgi:hypothetical protein